METLQITLFGHVSVVHPHANGPLKLSRSTQALFAYLLLRQHLVPRDVLMDVFWVNRSPDRARSSLTTALWRLRQLLEPDDVTPGTYLITGSMGEVGFNWDSGHFLDTKSFEQHIYPLLRKPNAELGDHDIEQIEQVPKVDPLAGQRGGRQFEIIDGAALSVTCRPPGQHVTPKQ